MELLESALRFLGELGVFQSLLLIPVAVGSIYAVLCLIAVAVFSSRKPRAEGPAWPAVTLLKPVCGLEKGLEENLRSACLQDHPEYQVVFSVQDPNDPTLPLLEKIRAEFGHELVTIVVAEGRPRANGKIHNLVYALRAARHELLAFSDSDVRLEPDFLRVITAPLRDDPKIGFTCTPYRAVGAERWFEKLELLSLHDFTVNVIFAVMTGASAFCLGSSLALRRSTLDAIGGLEPLEDYLVEDFELGKRIREQGLKGVLVPYSVDTMVDLPNAAAWWRHQLYWDKNTRFARPKGFFATLVIRPVAFALLFAAWRLFDPLGLVVLGATLALRIGTSAAILALLRDREGLLNLPWLAVRDLAGMAIWVLALQKGTVMWRGQRFELTPDGRMTPVPSQEEPLSGNTPVTSTLHAGD